MKFIKHQIQGIDVFIVSMGNLAGFFFEYDGKQYGDFVQLESPELFDETASILKDQAHDTIQRIK